MAPIQRNVGIRSMRPSHLDPVERARRHLWVAAFLLLAALSAVLVLVASSSADRVRIPGLPAGTLLVALMSMLAAFVAIVFDREAKLRSLAGRLTEERVEHARTSVRLRYLAELQRERDTNAALLESSADGVAVIDAELRLVRFNPAMQDLCGAPAQRALGAPAGEVLRFRTPDGRSLSGPDYPPAAVLADGLPRSGVELRLDHGGSSRWVSVTLSPVRDAGSGGPAFVLVVLRDIAAQKEIEALQRDFVSIVSHELRSPLTAIKGFAKTLIDRGDRLDPSARARFLSTVDSQADRLARLVDDLLQVARIDSRRLGVEWAEVDLPGLLDELHEQFRTRWSGRVTVDLPQDLPPIRADRRKLEEVLINLVDNALKYSPKGTQVEVGARAVDDEIQVWVADHGFGIAPEDLATLFQKFQRLSTPATRDIGGTGLGLYIVKGLVEGHGGRIWVSSAPGAGSTFSFALPAAPVALEVLA